MSTPCVTGDDVVELLERLVETPSVSGHEAGIVSFIAAQLTHWGIEPRVSGRNVWCEIEGDRGFGQTLLLQAHVDTVPPSEQWSCDPWKVQRTAGKVRGLGANDVKGGVAAMMCAVRDLARDPLFRGSVVFAATCDEETGGEGLEVLRPELPKLSAAVIAEPTRLRPACAQRGLMRVVVRCDGKAAHAARPWQGVNAIDAAISDIHRIQAIRAPRPNEILGGPTLAVTLIEGGTKANVIPPVCRFTLDVRPTPEYDNDWWDQEIRRTVEGTIEVMKSRITPVLTDPEDRLVQAALAATASTEPTGFGGVSDLFHVRDVPGIVLGPGLPEQSHQADEWIEEDQVRSAVAVYRNLVRLYLA